MCGIIIPLVVITYVNILGGLLHPFSGERVSLAVTMMLTGAAIYLVASDSMPKIGTVTLISRLYLSSLIHNFIALIVTVFVVSLHNISEADPVNEYKLHSVFSEATDGNGLMDDTALQIALHMLGLRGKKLGEAYQRILDENSSPLLLTQEMFVQHGRSVAAESLRATRHNFVVAQLFAWAQKRDRNLKKFLREETAQFKRKAQGKRQNDISYSVRVESRTNSRPEKTQDPTTGMELLDRNGTTKQVAEEMSGTDAEMQVMPI